MTFDRAVSVVLTICAVAIAGTVVRREFVVAPPPSANPQKLTATRLPDWKKMEAFGQEIVLGNGQLRLVEFTDLECPFCKAFQTQLAKVQAELGAAIGVTVIHTPLSMHKFAKPAAQAAACAWAQGKGAKFIDVAFAAQDSLASVSTVQLAERSGVTDLRTFKTCLDGPEAEAIALGKHLADSLDFHSTPIVILNGWRFSRPPNETELRQAVGRVIAGRDPVGN